MSSVDLESRLVGIKSLEITDFSDGKSLKTERIGSGIAVAFYNNNSNLGALSHPTKGTDPELFFNRAREQLQLTSSDTSVAIIGSSNADPATDYFIKGLVKLLDGAGYDIRCKGFKNPLLRDAVLYPDGTLEIYRHPTFYSEPEFEKKFSMS
jgi:hypothetical protein